MKLGCRWMGVFSLVVALVFAGCGDAADQDATLRVTSVPKGEVFVDGISHGESGSTIALPAGEHKIEVKLEGFVAHEERLTAKAGNAVTRDVTLAAKNPSDPRVIAMLAEAEGIDVAPFVAPETHRGSRNKRSVALLLWPAKDVRKSGLVNYAVEADVTYEGDATLEFRIGRKVLYREEFKPESVTTIRPIPAAVLEQAKVGRKITWGLYFEDSRRPLKTSFKVVQRPKADRQLDRLAQSRHMQRQPKITQAIMAATVLENNRLYTEALVSNLKIAADHPNSTQPYRGIVTTLRRLDAEDSELFAFVSPHVAGKGGRSGLSRPAATARDGGDLGIMAWSPTRKGALPTAIADAGPTARPGMAPGGQGVTPSGGATDSPTTPAEPGSTEGEAVPSQDARAHELDAMRTQLDEMKAAYGDAQNDVASAQAEAADAERLAEEAAAAAKKADEAALKARADVEQATDPTREQQEAMASAGRAAEDAREAASAARETAEAAKQKARDLESRADGMKQEIDTMGKALNSALGDSATPPGTEAPKGLTEDQAKDALKSAQLAADDAKTSWDVAKSAAEAADKAYAADPSEANRANVEAAQSALSAAGKHYEKMQTSLEAAKGALESLGRQVQEAGRK